MLPIYIVSLKQDTHKRDHIVHKLNELRIPFEFFDAVYGKELSPAFFDQLKPAGKSLETGAKPTPGEVGCTLSHLAVYELMLQRKQSWACILEDDVIFDGRLQDFYLNFQDDQVRLEKDSVYLMGGQNGIDAHPLVAKSFFTSCYIGQQKFTKLIKSESYVCRTCCYLISDDVAKRMVELAKTTFLLADDWEFLVRHHIIHTLYLADFVDHPIDLTLSSIELERQAVRQSVRAQLGKRRFSKRLINFIRFKIKCYLRMVMTQLYRFKR